jgi:Ran GTPase-activating protein (RanGAP) involved in mRNA processing and transport
MSAAAYALKKANQCNLTLLDILMNEYNQCKTSILLHSRNLYLNSTEMKIIDEWLKNITTLTSLSLVGNKITDDGLSVLAESLMVNTTVTHINLSGNKIGNIGANAFFKMLQTNKTITKLHLANNNISDIGIVSLENNTSLTILNLTSNMIDNAGLVSLVESIKFNRGLTKLSISFNIIGDSGQVFTTLFKNNSTLIDLSIYCDNITQDVFDEFIDILNLPSCALKKFNINMMNDFGYNYYSHGYVNYDKLVDAIKYNTTLQEFTFNSYFDKSYFETINEIFERNKFIEKNIYPLMCCVQRCGMFLPDEIWAKVANLY